MPNERALGSEELNCRTDLTRATELGILCNVYLECWIMMYSVMLS